MKDTTEKSELTKTVLKRFKIKTYSESSGCSEDIQDSPQFKVPFALRFSNLKKR